MSITIREPEQLHTISLSREGWLLLLSFLSEFVEAASSETAEAAARSLISTARGFVLIKEKAHEYKTQSTKESALELYLFFAEFKEQVKETPIISSIQESLKDYLLGGRDERD